jgi:hypothetical protein
VRTGFGEFPSGTIGTSVPRILLLFGFVVGRSTMQVVPSDGAACQRWLRSRPGAHYRYRRLDRAALELSALTKDRWKIASDSGGEELDGIPLLFESLRSVWDDGDACRLLEPEVTAVVAGIECGDPESDPGIRFLVGLFHWYRGHVLPVAEAGYELEKALITPAAVDPPSASGIEGGRPHTCSLGGVHGDAAPQEADHSAVAVVTVYARAPDSSMRERIESSPDMSKRPSARGDPRGPRRRG